MAQLQKFLRNGGTLDEIQENYRLKINTHKDHPNLHLFKYSQIRSPFSKRIVREARGIILDRDQNWKVVAYPYDKFFNYGEHYADPIDWSSAKVYDKLDGTLVTLYYYQGWQVSTGGLPDASGPVFGIGAKDKQKMSFNELFWQIWNVLQYELPNDRTNCYIFELTSPLNQVVVKQNENNLVLTGVRSLETFEEYDPIEYTKQNNWEVHLPKAYEFDSFDEMVRYARALDPTYYEGFVVVDHEFNRNKVKSVAYVELSQCGNIPNQTIKQKVLKIIQNNEGQEVLSAIPKWKDEYDNIKRLYLDLVNDIDRVYKESQSYESDRELADAIKEHWFMGCIFQLRREQIGSIEEWLQKQNTKSLLKRLNDQ